MTNPDIARRRMANQQIGAKALRTPVEIVRWMGAVQSQDYPGAKWAVGLRACVDDAAIEQAINDGSILRLHVLRPTWHFVAPENVRWMLALTARKIKAGMSARLRELQIDGPAITRSQEVFREALAGGQYLTRGELETALNQGGVSTDIPQRLAHLLVQAELDSLLINGPWKGKQATYALMDERIPPGKEPAELFQPVTAAAELARRFFTSHGPATLKDFAWWSGLTLGAIRAAVEAAQSSLKREEIDGQVYWGPSDEFAAEPGLAPSPAAHLLPNYDEYVVAYTDRSAIFNPALSDRLHMRGGVLNHIVIIDGMVAGGWKRELKKQGVVVTIEPIWKFSEEEQQAVEQAARRYGDFLGLPATLVYQYP